MTSIYWCSLIESDYLNLHELWPVYVLLPKCLKICIILITCVISGKPFVRSDRNAVVRLAGGA